MGMCDECHRPVPENDVAEQRYAAAHRHLFGWYLCRACTKRALAAAKGEE